MKQYFSTLRYDLPASLVVFLVATPLCLGIALASGAPLFAGLLSGVIGGIVVGALSGARLSVSGPAAGLTSIVLAAISSLGAYETLLLAVVLAGAIQLVLGVLRAGIIASFLPSSVITGMLAAIGVIIILKQIPHAFGYDVNVAGDLAFLQPDGDNTFSALLKPLWHIDVGATIITTVSLAILLVWDRPMMRRLRVIPGPLVAVVAGVLLNELFHALPFAKLAVDGNHLVKVPVIESFDELTGLLRFPDFSQLGNRAVWLTAVTLAAVASIETLLSIEAIDKIDPHKNITPPNRELFAQGAGNIAAGLIGGLPVTSVIVRSSANLAAGARSKVSAIAHGLLILGSVLFVPDLLNKIPLASLAAVLLVVGYKLAKPALFKRMYRLGIYQAIPFFVTVVAIVFTDLLTGVLIGLGSSIFGILRNNMTAPYSFHKAEFHSGDIVKLELAQEVSFLNKASILNTLETLPEGCAVHIDASHTKFIDYDVLEIIREFEGVRAPERGIKVTLVGFKDEYDMRSVDHVRVDTLKQVDRDRMTPERVVDLLREGNVRFVTNLRLHRDLVQQRADAHEAQHPMAAILSCSDSHTSPQIIFDLGLGDIVSARVAGNVLSEDILASLEFACKVAGAKVVVVLGHTNCGAVRGACAGLRLGHVSNLLERIEPAVLTIVPKTAPEHGNNAAVYDAVAHNNVTLMTRELTRRSPLLAAMVEARELLIVGGMYDIGTGHTTLSVVPELLPREVAGELSSRPAGASAE